MRTVAGRSTAWRCEWPSHGFTLIELLVVLVIIIVLSALGTSVWQRVQRSSRSAACMQNLRQIGAGLAKYVGEHDGVFPTLEMARAGRNEDVPVLDTELRGYVADARVFACPDDRKRLAEATGTSYLWNHRLNGQRLGSLSVSFVKMNPIEDPGRIMVMGDKEGFHPNLENKLNVLYADGHASQELTFVDDTARR
ncbi:MAG: prepilin-type N-terminal cleavage/methylation domain-containing protein [Chthoniobacteraceae bacterium]